MNTDSIRTLYDYHFALNRRIWDECITALTDEQFVEEIPYSLGAIRNQVVHMMAVDAIWFARLEEVNVPPALDPAHFNDRATARRVWDAIEERMRLYLEHLRDSRLDYVVTYTTRRFGECQSPSWQILTHVITHGVDHRAQVLAGLHALGAPTLEQDLMIHLWDVQGLGD
jgi:uncharacterized damage-inducible protein DinB